MWAKIRLEWKKIMKIGYISRRRDENGKETFKYREGTCTRRIGVRADTVKGKFLYGTYPYEEVLSNTEFFKDGDGLILVGEPFFTNDTLKVKFYFYMTLHSSLKINLLILGRCLYTIIKAIMKTGACV